MTAQTKEMRRNIIGTNNGIVSCSNIIDSPKIKTMDPHVSHSPELCVLVTARRTSSANSIPKRVIVPDKHRVTRLSDDDRNLKNLDEAPKRQESLSRTPQPPRFVSHAKHAQPVGSYARFPFLRVLFHASSTFP